ncbi:hypothetical protein GJ744_001013 [Endocarpon pusillum]|uniref:C2H2-type domain-containing protein n=1 Tax=Endocarpon pusillum TaxID=364733 RepID=A0A8H7AHM7_9EURO|nr:hypothetical protein GJ744_001013 [Endocarpon pusillum]
MESPEGLGSGAERIVGSGVSQKPGICITFSNCLGLFRQFILALGHENCRVVCLQQVKLPAVLDEYGRLKIWGDQIKASLPEKSRGSLDDTLKNEPKLKGVVLNILCRLQAQLDQAIPIAKRTYQKSLGSDQDSVSSVSADSDSAPNDEDFLPKARVSKISVLVSHIFEQVRSLYHLSMLLHRPTITDRYIRSKPKGERNSNQMSMSKYDYFHVREKVRQWLGQSKSSFGGCNERESATTLIDIQYREIEDNNLLSESEIIYHRLSRANTRRREQLTYWLRNPDKPCVVVPDEPRQISEPMPMKRVATAGESKSQMTTIKQPKAATTGLDKPVQSTTSKQSFSIVARSAIDDTKTRSGQPRTVYAQSTVGPRRSIRVPDLPVSAKLKPASSCPFCHNELTSTYDCPFCHVNHCPKFECPYCHLSLQTEIMEVRQVWKRHVFRDLRPYVCTFAKCQNPEKLYVTRSDWIYHESQMHRRQWVCGGNCGEICSTRDAMAAHFRYSHPESISESQIPICLDICERPIDLHQPTACMLCLEELSLLQLQGHIAEHMEEIALFVLPKDMEGIEDTDSKKVAGLLSQTAENTSQDASFRSSLGFPLVDEPNRSVQIPEGFARLLSMEEPSDTAKCASWMLNAEEEEIAMSPGPKPEESITSDVESKELSGDTLSPQSTEHPATLTSMANLASTYWNQGRWKELAGAFEANGQVKEALSLLEQVVKISEQTLAEDHPDRLASQHELARAYKANGQIKEAVSLLEHRASGLGQKETEQLLVDKGANIEATNKDGETALHRASESGQKEVMQLLVDKGANIHSLRKRTRMDI